MEDKYPAAVDYVYREAEHVNQKIVYRASIWRTVESGDVPDDELELATRLRFPPNPYGDKEFEIPERWK